MTTPEPRLPGVSTRDAAIMLGISQSDVLRRIKRGALKAERFDRPGGTILRVLLDPPDAASADTSLSESEATPEPRQDASEAIQAFAEALAAERAERQRLAEQERAYLTQIADLRERTARAEVTSEHASARATDLAAQLAAERAHVAALQADRDRLAAEVARRRWWRFWE